VDPIAPDRERIARAASFVINGGLVAFPTETVYGLGCDCYNPEAIRRIYEVKKRPPDNPLILHVSSQHQFEEAVVNIPETAWKVLEKAWPGPLTMVLNRSAKVPKEVSGGLGSVAVRMPAHPVALALIDLSGRPIAAPSANLSGKPSPTNAKHVEEDLSGVIEVIVDAGETFFGVESTIVDLTVEPPNLLRPGAFTVEELRQIIGRPPALSRMARGFAEAEVAISPGMKYRHYAPRTKMLLVEVADSIEKIEDNMLAIGRESSQRGERVAMLCSDETEHRYRNEGFITRSLGTRQNLYTVARSLFSALREVDSLGITLIVSEAFEEKGIGLAIMNRLRKASSSSMAANSRR